MTTALAKKDKREALWLEHYFGKDERVRGNATGAAISAGYDEAKAEAVGKRLESALTKRPLLDSLKAAGITRPKIALMLQEMSETDDPTERRLIMRLLLEVMGETKDSSGSSTIIAGQGAQILVVQGASPERMKNLKEGARPSLPTETNAQGQ